MHHRFLADAEARDTIVTLALTGSLKRDLRRVAFERGESMSSVARQILERELRQTDSPGPALVLTNS